MTIFSEYPLHSEALRIMSTLDYLERYLKKDPNKYQERTEIHEKNLHIKAIYLNITNEDYSNSKDLFEASDFILRFINKNSKALFKIEDIVSYYRAVSLFVSHLKDLTNKHNQKRALQVSIVGKFIELHELLYEKPISAEHNRANNFHYDVTVKKYHNLKIKCMRQDVAYLDLYSIFEDLKNNHSNPPPDLIALIEKKFEDLEVHEMIELT